MTKIQLIGDVWNEGINAYLELSEEVDVPLNFAVSDIRDLSKRTGTFSKSIRVAGTKANSQVLNHLYDVNIVSGTATFDINKRQSCVLIQDGQVILDNAVMQLTDVVITSQGGGRYDRVDYLITVKDTMSDFFTSLGNARLQDLDFSDLNHVYNSTNVVASFDHNYTDGYKYLLPITDDNVYDLIEMKPAIYAREYWDRIHARAGFSWQWDDRNDMLFDQWIHPYSGEKAFLDEETLEEFKVVAEESGTQTNSQIGSSGGFAQSVPYLKLNVSNEISDPAAIYTAASSVYNSPFVLYNPNTLKYKISYTFELRMLTSGASGNVELWDGSAGFGAGTGIIIKPRFRVRNATGQTLGTTTMQPDFVNADINHDGNGGFEFKARSFEIDFISGTVVASGTATTILTATGISDTDVLQLGTSVSYGGQGDYRWLQAGVTRRADIRLNVTDISIEILPSSETIYPNMTLPMNNYSIKNVKQSDYIKSILTMGNVYAIPAPNDPRKMIYKTRDQYYDEGDVKDWNDKLAKDREHKITFLPELTAKRLKLTYKEDRDVLNVGYLQNVGEIYGEVEYIFDNEYIKNDERKEVIFGPTPFVTTSFGASVLGINGVEPKILPRVVIDGGKYSCSPYSIFDFLAVGQTVNEYPYAGHFDRPVNPAFDINFGKCAFYFSDQFGLATDNNLANIFWRRTMAQINSGKMLTGMFNLTVNDIASLKLNDKIYLLGQYWFINKIIDYNANKRQLTKVELLSADEFVTLPPFKVLTPSTPTPNDGVIGVPVEEMVKERNRSLNISPVSVTVIGKRNYIAPDVRNALIVGDGQTIEEDGIYTPRLVVNGVPVVADTQYQTIGIINQTSTNPIIPTNTIFDSIGYSASTRIGVGEYELTTLDTFVNGVVFTTNGSGDGFITADFNSPNGVFIRSHDATGALADGIIKDASIMIKLYK